MQSLLALWYFRSITVSRLYYFLIVKCSLLQEAEKKVRIRNVFPLDVH